MVTTQFEELTRLVRPSLVFRRLGRKVNIGEVVRLRTNSFVVEYITYIILQHGSLFIGE